MGSQSEKLVIGRKYYLNSSSKGQSWNNGICVLDSIEKNRALVTKLEGSSSGQTFNVPINSLYGFSNFICIESLETKLFTHKVGDIIETTTWHYENTYVGEFFKPLHEFREERINQILE